MRYLCIALVLFLAIPLHAQKLNVIFFGLSDESIPAIKEAYDKKIRDRLSVHPLISLADYRQTRIYRKRSGFSNYPTVSRDLVQELMNITGDSTLVVWGEAEDFNIAVHRKNLIETWVTAHVRLRLVMYSLSFRQNAYVGVVAAKHSIKKGWALFRPVKTVTHVSVADRQLISDSLIQKVTRKSERAIVGVVRSWLERGEPIREPASGVQQQQVPRIEDLFGIPSVEGENLGPQEQSNESDTTTPQQIEPPRQPPSLPVP